MKKKELNVFTKLPWDLILLPRVRNPIASTFVSNGKTQPSRPPSNEKVVAK